MPKKRSEFIPAISYRDLAKARAAQPARVPFHTWDNYQKKKGGKHGEKTSGRK